MPELKGNRVLCLGAGPAGLTAAYKLAGSTEVTVIEKDPAYVGGISRTEERDGYRFDIGGHRFFSQSPEIEALWTEILGDDLVDRPRKSRILYGGKLYDYPLRGFDALGKLGIVESALCVSSYAFARLRPVRDPATFEDWVSNMFGKRLFRIFFKTYTEKVWGMPCSAISADWAAQRIKGLSLGKAIVTALIPQRGRKAGKTVKTLIDTFRYPRLGPGMMWEAARRKIEERGGTVELGVEATALRREGGAWIVEGRVADGSTRTWEADHVISTMPLRELAARVSPPLPPEATEAARGLAYRDFLTVALVVRSDVGFDDNWIYVHEPGVKVGRIQNFNSWSPEMVPDPATTCLGLEYFCFEGDGLWSASDGELVELAKRELDQLRLVRPEDVQKGFVIRQPKAYPTYDEGYAQRVRAIRDALERDCPGLHCIGRNGMHKYNNQDHAMMTGILVAENILAGRNLRDPWRVNVDAEYHEEGEAGAKADSEGRNAPPPPSSQANR
jgi:protoporphyrinogen oxidase